ncbi:GntR family transcriptional regulator [Lachnospiraceae bacterium 62-35]
MADIVRKEAYHQQIYEIIKKKILGGELKRGDRINEFSLAEELEVSRSPVREALRMLERDGILIRGTRNDLIVNPVDREAAIGVYHLRLCLEPAAAEAGCPWVTKAVLEELKACVEQSEQCHKERDMEGAVSSDARFHETISRLCPNKHLRKMIDRNEVLSWALRKDEFVKFNRSEEYLSEHKGIIESLRSGDGRQTGELMRKHIIGDREFYSRCASI